MPWDTFASSSGPGIPVSASIVFGHPAISGGPSWPGPWTSQTWHQHAPASTSSPSAAVVAGTADTNATPAPPPETALPNPPPQPARELSKSLIAAAIVIPILFISSALALGYLCYRRRSRAAHSRIPVSAVPVTGLKEKLGSFRRARTGSGRAAMGGVERTFPPSAAEPPILMSEQNNAYYTGLDTASYSSRPSSGEYLPRASYEGPPPPYIRDPSPPPVDGVVSDGTVGDGRMRSPFDDPTDPQMFTEDSYASGMGYRRVSNPFVSPLTSPILPGEDEGRRRVSDVSEIDRV